MLTTIMDGKSSDVMKEIMPILLPDAKTVLDVTYGNGSFWNFDTGALDILGSDLRPVGDVVANYTDLPFSDNLFDIVVFDPPFLTDVSKKNSIMGKQYTSYPTMGKLKSDVQQGLREAKRVSKLGIVYKCQDYIHGSKPIWMSDWAREIYSDTEPYDIIHLRQQRKLISPSWKNQYSAWRNNSTFIIYRWDSIVHKKR